MNHTPGTIIETLKLSPHPEGGYYKETYRSGIIFDAHTISASFSGKRCCKTAIYYLLEAGDFSSFHRIKADEIWHFYEGSPLTVHVIHPDGELSQIQLGKNITTGEVYQAEVPAGCWFAASVNTSTGYTLTGCTTAPGFEFEDFEIADRNELIELFPQHQTLIRKYTRI